MCFCFNCIFPQRNVRNVFLGEHWIQQLQQKSSLPTRIGRSFQFRPLMKQGGEKETRESPKASPLLSSEELSTNTHPHSPTPNSPSHTHMKERERSDFGRYQNSTSNSASVCLARFERQNVIGFHKQGYLCFEDRRLHQSATLTIVCQPF